MIFVIVIKVILLTLLLVSSVSKLVAIDSFRKTLAGLQLPLAFVKAGSWVVPFAEMVIGVGLMIEPIRFVAEIALMMLLLSFGWSVYRAKSKKLKINCNCFGNLVSEEFGWKTISHILVFFILNLVLILIPNQTNIHSISIVNYILIFSFTVVVIMIYALGTAYYEYLKRWNLITRGRKH